MKNLKKAIGLVAGVIALVGFGLAFRNKKAVSKAEKNYPPLGRFCNVQGCSIHYYSEGEGQTVILIHGEKGDIYDFYLSPLWKSLKEKYQVVAFDRPGYGYSKRADWKDYGFRNQAEILHQTIQSLELKNPVLVGYGESSGIVLSMIMEHKDDYKAAVLLEDKVPKAAQATDKVISKPVLGDIYLWTVAPVLEENKSGKNKSDSSDEYSNKSKTFDTQPSKLLSSSEDKMFMDIKELEKLTSFHSKINNPVTVIRGASYKSNNDLVSSLKLEGLFPNLNIVNIPSAESFISMIKSERVPEEISKLAD